MRKCQYVNGGEYIEGQGNLGKFIEDAESIVLAVDCENSDPYCFISGQ